MIVLGMLLVVWGALLLGLARPLHENWRGMVGKLRSAGYDRPPFGTRFVASQRGLRTIQVLGACGAVLGALLVGAGMLR